MPGKLKLIDLRNFRKDEQTDFTPWLAKYENIKELGEKLIIDVRITKTEADIGEKH